MGAFIEDARAGLEAARDSLLVQAEEVRDQLGRVTAALTALDTKPAEPKRRRKAKPKGKGWIPSERTLQRVESALPADDQGVTIGDIAARFSRSTNWARYAVNVLSEHGKAIKVGERDKATLWAKPNGKPHKIELGTGPRTTAGDQDETAQAMRRGELVHTEG